MRWRDAFVSGSSPLPNHSHHLSLSSGYLEEEVKKVNIKLAPGGNVQAPDPQDMIDLEVMIFIVLVGVDTPLSLQSKFEVLEAEVKEINANKITLKRNLLDLIELQHILQGTQIFFQEVNHWSCDPHVIVG